MQRLNTSQVMARLGIRSRETLRTLVAKRGFPKPVHDPGSSINYFLEPEVNQYLEGLKAARDAASQEKDPQPISA